MKFEKIFEKYVYYLESYRGRDKVIRCTSYCSLLLGGLIENKNKAIANKLFVVVSELNACRVVLRLFDDSSMAAYCLKYGTGSNQEHLFLRVVQIISNIFGQAFYLVEHLAWASEKKLISMDATPWLLLSLVTWIICLVMDILKSVWKIFFNPNTMRYIKENKERRPANFEITKLVESFANLAMAINWLPLSTNFKLPNSIVGLLGVTSTIASIVSQ